MQNLVRSLTEEIETKLPRLTALSQENCRRHIRRYTGAIEGNFIGWMAAAGITARSIHGRFAADENLQVEIRDDHPGMLHSFAESAGALPRFEEQLGVKYSVAVVRRMLGQMNGLQNLALMAALEGSSSAFIPFLEKLAIRCGSENLHYTKVHGEADAAHADQFLKAVEMEGEQYPTEQRRKFEFQGYHTAREFLLPLFELSLDQLV